MGARDTVVIAALTAAGAATDAISYLGLGHVFPANMTGNTVLLGIGAATHDGAAVRGSATALGAYVLAAAAVAAAVPARPGRWRLRLVLLAELSLLLAAAVWWLARGDGSPAGGPRLGLIALAGAAMGTQSALTVRLGLPVGTTTYITGTWTRLSMVAGSLVHRSAERPAGKHGPQALVVVLYPVAGFAAAAAFTRWHPAAMLLPVALLAGAAVAREVQNAHAGESRERPAGRHPGGHAGGGEVAPVEPDGGRQRARADPEAD